MQMYITKIQFAKHKNRNSELPAFGVTALLTLLIVIQVIYVYPFYYKIKNGSRDFLEALQKCERT